MVTFAASQDFRSDVEEASLASLPPHYFKPSNFTSREAHEAEAGAKKWRRGKKQNGEDEKVNPKSIN
ncbi:hypothetical protein KFK09_015747 [Dendrobium nobile]|uniref:Uncharacterized protein n=1 Tax=Dendrobium nobile TaxID=94219 RepID=A0A8T3B5N9_DENNO|nr:hypothetical protein KFK09_015747 [Dendrobium nobile]